MQGWVACKRRSSVNSGDWLQRFDDVCGSPLLKEANHYTSRTIPQEHWSIGMSMARPS